MHDRAAVNDVDIRTIKVVHSALLNIGCFSHILDLVLWISIPFECVLEE